VLGARDDGLEVAPVAIDYRQRIEILDSDNVVGD
jgi:hypothetical protein